MRQSSDRTFSGYVANFSITKSFDDRGIANFDIEVALAAEWGPSSTGIRLRFAGPRDVRYGDARQGIDFGDCLLLRVTDVTEAGWEDIRFKVENIESGCSLSLYCRKFEVLGSFGT